MDYTQLGLGGLASFVTNIEVKSWGDELVLHCLYDPTGERLPYRLIFQSCQHIRLDVHDAETAAEAEADVIDFKLGKPQHQESALIYTDIFELEILYGSVTLEKPDYSSAAESLVSAH